MEAHREAQMDEFALANQSLIASLQEDNKNLRIEVARKEEDLRLAIQEISRMSSDGSSASEKFLAASLSSARESITSLDLANQELLEAIESAQVEISRLSTAGMELNSKHNHLSALYNEVEAERNQLGIAIDELLSNGGDEIHTLRAQIQEKDAFISNLQSKMKKNATSCDQMKGKLEDSIRQLTIQVQNGEDLIETLRNDIKECHLETASLGAQSLKDIASRDNEIGALKTLIQELELKIITEESQSKASHEMTKQSLTNLSSELQICRGNLEEATAEYESLKSELSVKSSRIKDVESQLETCMDDKRSKERQILEMENQIKTFEATNETLTIQMKELQIENVSANRQIDELNDVISGLESELKDAEQNLVRTSKELGLVSNERDVLSANLHALNNRCDESQNRLQSLRTELSMAQNNNELLETKFSNFKQTMSKLQVDHDNTCRLLSTQKQRCSSSNDEVVALQSALTKALEDLATLSEKHENKFMTSFNKIAALSDEISALKQKEGSLCSEIEMKSQEIKEFVAKLEEKESQLRAKDAYILSLSQKISDYSSVEIPQLEIELGKRGKTCQNLSDEVEELNGVVKGLESEISELQRDLEMSKSSLVSLYEENGKYKTSLDNTNAKLGEAQQLKTRISKMEQEEEASLHHVNHLERDLLMAQDKVQLQDSNIKVLTEELFDVRADLGNVKSALSQQESAHQDLQLQDKQKATEIESLKKKLEIANSTISLLKNDIRSNNELVQKLEEQIGSLKIESTRSDKIAESAISELGELKKDFEVQADCLRQSQATVSSLTANFSKIPSHVCTCDLQRQLDKSLESLDNCEAKLSSMRAELFESRKTIEIRDNEVSQFQSRVDGYYNENVALEQTITSLRGQVFTLEGENRELLYQIERSKDETRRYAAEVELYKGRISACNSQVDILESELSQWKIREVESETKDVIDKGLLMSAQSDAAKSNARCCSLETFVDSLGQKLKSCQLELRQSLDREMRLTTEKRNSEMESNSLKEKNNDFNDKILELKKEVDSLSKENMNSNNNSLEKDAILALQKQELKELHNKLELYEYTDELSNSQDERVDKSVSSLMSELEACQQSRDVYHLQCLQLNDVQCKLENMNNSLGVKDAEIQTLTGDISNLKLKVSELKKSLEVSKHHENLLEDTIACRNLTVDDLTREIKSIHADLRRKATDLASANTNVNNAFQKCESLEADLKHSNDEVTALKASKKELELEIDSLEKQIIAINIELDRSKNQCNISNDGLSEAQTQILQMEKELKQLRTSALEKENKCIDITSEFAKRLSAAEDRALHSSADLADVQATLIATTRDLQTKNTEIEILRNSFADDIIAKLNSQISELKNVNTKLEEELALEKIKSRDKKSLQDEIAKLKCELGKMQESTRVANDKIMENNRLHDEMKTEYDGLSLSYKDCRDRLDNIREELKKSIQENDMLKQEISCLNSNLDRDNLELLSFERDKRQQFENDERRRREEVRKCAEEERLKNEAVRIKAQKEAHDTEEAAKKAQEAQKASRLETEIAVVGEADKRNNLTSPVTSEEEHAPPTRTMKGIDDRGKEVDIPHVLSIKIVGAEDLNSSNVFGYPTPDAYVLVNALKKPPKGKKKVKGNPCYSTAKTSIVKQSYNPQWHEEVRATIVGSGYLILNIFSFSVIAGDTFLGQAVIDLDEHVEIYHEQSFKLTLPILKATHPVYSHDGTLMRLLTVKGKGKITVQVNVPSVFSNMCGWFTEVRLGWNADIIGVKIWVELVEGVLNCYESPHGGSLINTIDCKRISDIVEIMYDKLEIKIEAVKITLMNIDPNLPPTEMIWGWANDRNRLKKLWRRALICNHGSGVVSVKTASAISRHDESSKE